MSASSSEDHHHHHDYYATDELDDSVNLPDDSNSSSRGTSNNLPTDISKLQQESDIFFMLLSLVCKNSHLDMR
jgi:hypothetical protein